MKRKRNPDKVPEEELHSQTDLYLPDEGWELVLEFLNCHDKRNCRYLKYFSLVSKQLLSITNRFRFSLTVYQQTLPFLPRLFQRFTNLTSVNFSLVSCDLDKLLPQISQFPLNVTSLNISNRPSFPRMKLHGMMNFELPRLKVLDLSITTVDDEELNIISKACRGLLQLSLRGCQLVTENGVKHVLENCTQLREINIGWCDKVHPNIVASMLFSRPSLRKITAPPECVLSDTEKEVFDLQGCIVC